LAPIATGFWRWNATNPYFTRSAAYLTGVLPLPSHFEQRGGNIRRPGRFGCTTGTKPVPLQPEHARSLMGCFGQSALLVRIAFPV
jgi:hypothetical protein